VNGFWSGYYLTKIHSLQFAAKTNFNMSFWEGLGSAGG